MPDRQGYLASIGMDYGTVAVSNQNGIACIVRPITTVGCGGTGRAPQAIHAQLAWLDEVVIGMIDMLQGARFEHSHGCCFATLSGVDTERVFGADDVQVVQYGRWSWPSWSLLMVSATSAQTTAEARERAAASQGLDQQGAIGNAPAACARRPG